MTPRYFEDFAEGQVCVTDGVTLSEAMMIDFGLRFDPQAIHIDREAAQHTLYKGLIASGWMVAALSFRMLVQSGFVAGGSLGSPGVDELRWLKPVRPGDTIHTEAAVTFVRPSSKGGRGYVHLQFAVKNQRGETVMTFRSVQIMATRPQAAPA